MKLIRYFKIFLLHFQLTLEVKSLSFVWFLSSLLTPLLMLIFWSGATAAQGGSILSWSYSSFATYYLLVALAGSLFVAHIEEDVATKDINRGELSVYLLRPMPYYGFKFINELPWRVLQGCFAFISIFLVFLFAPHLIRITNSPLLLFLAILMMIFAYLTSFSFKMCLGLIAFWFTEISGLMQITEIILTLCGGVIVPLVFLPPGLKLLFDILPFSYMVYYPIIALLGKLSYQSELTIIGIQMVWMCLFGLLYKFLWNSGRRKFTALGR